VPAEYSRSDDSVAGGHVRPVDFGGVHAKDWLAVNEFTVTEGHHNRQPVIVVLLNEPPLGPIELRPT
jgi:type I restriction enzyme, R subunit